MNSGKIHKMSALFYNRMYQQLKKAVSSHDPKDKRNNSNLRIGSQTKKLKLNKNNLTLNLNAINTLSMSRSIKDSTLSSHNISHGSRAIKTNNSLKTQANSPSKIQPNLYQPQEFRYHTSEEQKRVRVVLEYDSHTFDVQFRESMTIQEMKLELFQLMLSVGRNNPSKLVDLVTFESTREDLDVFVDYWMGEPKQTLSIFTSNDIETLKLRPLFYSVSQKEVNLTDFVVYRCIGMGGFSRVYLGKCKRDGKLCALKFIDKNNIKNSKKFILNERTILGSINHPNIISLYHSFQTKNYIVFALEYCPNNELFQYLKRRKHLAEDQSRWIFKQILDGIQYLHSKKVLYRDLKLENILIDALGRIKITDFGLSKPNCNEGEITYSYCGSPEYMAPEMLLKCGHSYEVDYYTLGILLYELLLGNSPFLAKTKKEIYFGALHHEVRYSKEIPLTKQVKDLLQGLLHKNPSHRIGSQKGIKQIKEHPWVRKKGDIENGFSRRLFREYRQAQQPSMSWLEEQFQHERTPYQKLFKHVYYSNALMEKERMESRGLFQLQARRLMPKSRTTTNSPVLRRGSSKTFVCRPKNPYLKKMN